LADLLQPMDGEEETGSAAMPRQRKSIGAWTGL
jgi:hypothetical protein